MRRLILVALATACAALLVALGLNAALRAPHLVESSSAMEAVLLSQGRPLYPSLDAGANGWVHPPVHFLALAAIERVTGGDPVALGRALSLAMLLLGYAVVLGIWRRDGGPLAVPL